MISGDTRAAFMLPSNRKRKWGGEEEEGTEVPLTKRLNTGSWPLPEPPDSETSSNDSSTGSLNVGGGSGGSGGSGGLAVDYTGRCTGSGCGAGPGTGSGTGAGTDTGSGTGAPAPSSPYGQINRVLREAHFYSLGHRRAGESGAACLHQE